MAVVSVQICLQASHEDGRGVSRKAFLTPFAIKRGEVESTHANGGAWEAGLICFATVRSSDFAHVDATEDAGAPSEAFHAAIQKALLATAQFLNQRPAQITKAMRAAGLELRLFIEPRMDQDQMVLDLPPKLVTACSKHRLGIFVISNDF